MQTPVGVEKAWDCMALLRGGAAVFFAGFLVADRQRCCRLAEEANQALDVLRRRGQEELLAYELHPAQA